MRRIVFGVVVIALLVAAPFAAYQIWGFDLRVWAQEFIGSEDEPEVTVVEEVEEVEEEVVPAVPVGPRDWMADMPQMQALFTPDEITSERYIEVEELIEPEELLLSGETLPEENLIPIYAAARTPGRMIDYCTEVLDTIADNCDVIRSEVRDNRDGRLRLLGRLGYTTPIPLGEPAPLESGVFLSARVTLPFQGELRPENEPNARIAAILDAQNICETLRTRFGNCVLSRVDFTINELWITDLEVLPEGTEPQRLNTTAHYTVYADGVDWTDESFAALVTDLANP